MLVKARYLGIIKYQAGLQIQRRLVEKHKNKLTNSNAIVLLQHFPVYTVGIRTKAYPETEADRLKGLGAEFFYSNRGGLITFHGPGQLVAYPILNLRQLKIGVRDYIDKLEGTVIRMCSSVGIEANRSPYTGVWVGDYKICAIGIRVSSGITYHGIGLNCNTDLSWFEHIVPCGIEGRGVTSLSKQLSRDFTYQEAVMPLLRAFEEEFKFSIELDAT